MKNSAGLGGGGRNASEARTRKWSEGEAAETLMTGERQDWDEVITESRMLLLR